MEIPAEVLRRARALQAMAHHPASTVYEVQTALQKAHELLAQYHLTLEDLPDSASPSIEIVRETYKVPGRFRRDAWLQELMYTIGEFTDTRTLEQTNPVSFSFVGIVVDVQRAVHYADVLSETVRYFSEYVAPRAIRDIRVYRQGLVDAIRHTMRELNPAMGALKRVAREKPSGTSLIIVKHELITKFIDDVAGGYAHRAQRRHGTQLDYQIGYRDGKTIDIIDGYGVHRRVPYQP